MNASKTLKAGVMGWPVGHSLSPRLHSYWLKLYGIDGSFEALPVKPEDLAKELGALSSKGFVGVNLTVPHKEAALTLMDQLDPTAKRIGAVNTVLIKDDKLEGRNTDAYGFVENIKAGGFKAAERPVAILGAGGAARAAIAGLIEMGVKDIRVINRTIEKAAHLAQEFSTMEQSHFLPPDESVDDAIRHIHSVNAFAWGDEAPLKNISLLINATSLGLKGQPRLSIDLDALPKDAMVNDMVYAPLMTGLLLDAEKRGNKIIDGLGMLLHQARPAFRAFFGIDPEVNEELRRFILEALK